MSKHTTKDPARVVAGLKAATHNPNVSAEAKEQAMGKLKEMGQVVEPPAHEPSHTHGPEASVRELAGYKATLSNARTSTEAKKHAEEVLQAAGIHEKDPGHSDEQHQIRVLAGYKAAIHNSRVSEEAKQHAREYLQEQGVET